MIGGFGVTRVMGIHLLRLRSNLVTMTMSRFPFDPGEYLVIPVFADGCLPCHCVYSVLQSRSRLLRPLLLYRHECARRALRTSVPSWLTSLSSLVISADIISIVHAPRGSIYSQYRRVSCIILKMPYILFFPGNHRLPQPGSAASTKIPRIPSQLYVPLATYRVGQED